ncbi:MAG TPA: gluconate 2-dehydrogenase subunit 3 family protein [Vicinamibacterales bacterium]|nr:gluconate 2-dehydrogenase subunit 3 family protein [Vicinamibacterales bacterium]
MTTFISRRDLLKTTALLAGARAFQASGTAAAQRTAEIAARGAAPETLTAREMEILDAIAARLIPNDALGPGAVEAGATRYIDRALGGALASSRQAYAAGLAALDRYAQSSRGKPFTDLPPADQDSVLIDVELGAATGFAGSSAPFFAMVLGHTHQGMFADPFYGGNYDFAGWDLVGYPGVRTMVTAADQHSLEAKQLKPNHKSAYDYDAFNKAEARASRRGPDEGEA